MIKTENCIGCQACVDVCPVNAIEFFYDEWGDGRARIDNSKCIQCKLCDRICPADNIDFNDEQREVYAMISEKNNSIGSSGGIFYELAKEIIKNGGVVYGATFNSNLKLVHCKSETEEQLIPLCKSKYIHSNLEGVYKEIENILKKGKTVMFVGTPCQVSAMKNLYYKKYKNLLLIDFLCHGTGTQKIFDLCIKEIEKKKKGKITSFNFRAKSRKSEHSFRYNINIGKKKKYILGYSFEFSYYFSFLKYIIFNDACYNCKYNKTTRVGDITLGDFWGIQDYNTKLKDEEGVSMVSVNTFKGEKIVEKIKKNCVWYSYPIEYATKKNQAFNSSKQLLKEKKELQQLLKEKKELQQLLKEKKENVLLKRLSCPNIKKRLIYAKMPQKIIEIYHKIRGKK